MIKLDNPIETYTDELLADLYTIYASNPVTTHEDLAPFRREFRRRNLDLPEVEPTPGLVPELVPAENLHPCGITGPDHRHLTRVDAVRCTRGRRAR